LAGIVGVSGVRGWIIDPDKHPTTMRGVVVGDVDITSRHQKKHELWAMTNLIFSLDDDMREVVVSIWCDSNATSSWTVTMKDGMDQVEVTRPIGRRLAETALVHFGGHNDICVGTTWHEDPDWDEP
jgi:hypothetical protein